MDKIINGSAELQKIVVPVRAGESFEDGLRRYNDEHKTSFKIGDSRLVFNLAGAGIFSVRP